jgi:hypothetical protein
MKHSYMLGLTEFYLVAKDPALLEYIRNWAEYNRYSLCRNPHHTTADAAIEHESDLLGGHWVGNGVRISSTSCKCQPFPRGAEQVCGEVRSQREPNRRERRV